MSVFSKLASYAATLSVILPVSVLHVSTVAASVSSAVHLLINRYYVGAAAVAVPLCLGTAGTALMLNLLRTNNPFYTAICEKKSDVIKFLWFVPLSPIGCVISVTWQAIDSVTAAFMTDEALQQLDYDSGYDYDDDDPRWSHVVREQHRRIGLACGWAEILNLQDVGPRSARISDAIFGQRSPRDGTQRRGFARSLRRLRCALKRAVSRLEARLLRLWEPWGAVTAMQLFHFIPFLLTTVPTLPILLVVLDGVQPSSSSAAPISLSFGETMWCVVRAPVAAIAQLCNWAGLDWLEGVHASWGAAELRGLLCGTLMIHTASLIVAVLPAQLAALPAMATSVFLGTAVAIDVSSLLICDVADLGWLMYARGGLVLAAVLLPPVSTAWDVLSTSLTSQEKRRAISDHLPVSALTALASQFPMSLLSACATVCGHNGPQSRLFMLLRVVRNGKTKEQRLQRLVFLLRECAKATLSSTSVQQRAHVERVLAFLTNADAEVRGISGSDCDDTASESNGPIVWHGAPEVLQWTHLCFRLLFVNSGNPRGELAPALRTLTSHPPPNESDASSAMKHAALASLFLAQCLAIATPGLALALIGWAKCTAGAWTLTVPFSLSLWIAAVGVTVPSAMAGWDGVLLSLMVRDIDCNATVSAIERLMTPSPEQVLRKCVPHEVVPTLVSSFVVSPFVPQDALCTDGLSVDDVEAYSGSSV